MKRRALTRTARCFTGLAVFEIDWRLASAHPSRFTGDQAFSFIGAAAFSSTAGELRYAGNFLEADVNGDGAADFQVQLNVASLQSSDFFL